MSEIEVTRVWREEIETLSGSAFELGENAGRITWDNCMQCAREFGDELKLDIDEVRDHVRAYGAWTDQEIDAMSDLECKAFIIQEAAARLREHEDNPEFDGNLYVDEQGKAWIYLNE